MDQDEWELEVDRDIRQWFSESETNLANELRERIARGNFDSGAKISDGSGREGDRDVAAIILATAALVKVLKPIIITLIRQQFPKGTITEHRLKGKRVLRVSSGE